MESSLSPSQGLQINKSSLSDGTAIASKFQGLFFFASMHNLTKPRIATRNSVPLWCIAVCESEGKIEGIIT